MLGGFAFTPIDLPCNRHRTQDIVCRDESVLVGQDPEQLASLRTAEYDRRSSTEYLCTNLFNPGSNHTERFWWYRFTSKCRTAAGTRKRAVTKIKNSTAGQLSAPYLSRKQR